MTFWDFIGSDQFGHLVTLSQVLVVVVLIPLYRKLSRMIAALKRIPIIEVILSEHDERISTLETHKVNAKPGLWPL